ncbi:SDR family oxidoreductase [Rhodoferax sp. BLA1]|uniref:dTDP-4-dehydrorhamnose reductase family protein n=1 Tax=Rhodoferax sp. BLA1 TaxID=2576062 RepID=UPI0015D17B34|nr:SDR family oxidoreductase [Rhodoferax sp. BLA1]
MKVLVIGVTGMLGNAMFRVLSEDKQLSVHGSARNVGNLHHVLKPFASRILSGVDVENHDSLVQAFAVLRPDVVVNCVGLVKQLADANDPLLAVPINTLLPHRLAALCQVAGARLVHISTDCVFSGAKGNYQEDDFPDAYDLYGRSKLLGEVDYPHAITLRTSIIGHELTGKRSLVNWFLSQQGAVRGFTRAIFSGLPTVELATVVRDVVLPHHELHGLYHVSAEPINKFNLLKLVAGVYGKTIEINASEDLIIDRSLNSDRFRKATGYQPPDWPVLIQRMYEFQ